ncbi:Thermonuclease precursor [Bremerella volcania]|uniref:Thermonuclease n=1 Tax=Bremerella volcania TaxID=2527984 RepID=A0A518CG53_9BACT|nr:thermonuclease family protein [Bremerella volcania]QDU78212.1 Thermonuclease precursor [Bremerella volcania]
MASVPVSVLHSCRLVVVWAVLAMLPASPLWAQAQPDPPLVDSFRQWHDASGKLLTKSRLAYLDGDRIALWAESGQMLLIPQAQVSAADQSWIIAHPVKILRGKVIYVADGDTIGLLDADEKQHRIRLEGIDAPERGQAFGTKSRQALNDAAYGKDVIVAYEKPDQYGRILGHIYLNERWLNYDQLVSGMAWHYRHFSGDAYLAQAQKRAEAEKAGLWRDVSPLPPWRYRLAEKRQQEMKDSETAAKPMQPTGYWLNTSSGVRHNETCEHYGKTSRGKYCGAEDGKPCGMCGG